MGTIDLLADSPAAKACEYYTVLQGSVTGYAELERDGKQRSFSVAKLRFGFAQEQFWVEEASGALGEEQKYIG